MKSEYWLAGDGRRRRSNEEKGSTSEDNHDDNDSCSNLDHGNDRSHQRTSSRVDDTGVGIDEADLPKVFDVAYRWPATEVTARACILGGGAAARAIGDARERKSAGK